MESPLIVNWRSEIYREYLPFIIGLFVQLFHLTVFLSNKVDWSAVLTIATFHEKFNILNFCQLNGGGIDDKIHCYLRYVGH